VQGSGYLVWDVHCQGSSADHEEHIVVCKNCRLEDQVFSPQLRKKGTDRMLAEEVKVLLFLQHFQKATLLVEHLFIGFSRR
jgi:hypothetical protein